MSSFFALSGNPFAGNPFGTTVGAKIERATDSSLASENWALNMEICDMINESEEAAKDAMRAIRKRLTQGTGKNYNYTVVLYTLTVLETCVKNCGKRFHLLVCSKDFVQELVKIIGPKNDPPTAVQEKVLCLIQSWADAFISQPDLSGVVSVYQELQAKGIEFPSTNLDGLAPIHTPEKSVKAQPSSSPRPVSGSASGSPPQSLTIAPPPSTMQTGQAPPPPPPNTIIISPGALTAEQRAKLQSELDVVQSNLVVFGEMLAEIKPGCEQSDELELLQELNISCKSMQSRVVELIGRLSNDELTAELLRINDDLNNLFLRYSRYEKNRDSIVAQGPSPVVFGKAIGSTAVASGGVRPKEVTKSGPTSAATDASQSLIDWGPADDDDAIADDLSTQLTKMALPGENATAQLAKVGSTTARNGPQGDTDEFDMFAQSRKATYETTKPTSGAYKEAESNLMDGVGSFVTSKNKPKDTEFDEMAAWLDETPGTEEGVTSKEFDRFLAERAAAAEALPPATNRTATTVPAPSTNVSINSQKDEKSLQLL